MAKSDHIYHGDPRHHADDISKLKQKIEELEEEIQKERNKSLAKEFWRVRGW